MDNKNIQEFDPQKMHRVTEFDCVIITWFEFRREGALKCACTDVWSLFDKIRTQICPQYSPENEDFKDIVDSDRVIEIVGISWKDGYEKCIPYALSHFASYFRETTGLGYTVIVSSVGVKDADLDEIEEFVDVTLSNTEDKDAYQISNYGTVLKNGQPVQPIMFEDGPRIPVEHLKEGTVYVSVPALMSRTFEPKLTVRGENSLRIKEFKEKTEVVATAFDESCFNEFFIDGYDFDYIFGNNQDMVDKFIDLAKDMEECF